MALRNTLLRAATVLSGIRFYYSISEPASAGRRSLNPITTINEESTESIGTVQASNLSATSDNQSLWSTFNDVNDNASISDSPNLTPVPVDDDDDDNQTRLGRPPESGMFTGMRNAVFNGGNFFHTDTLSGANDNTNDSDNPNPTPAGNDNENRARSGQPPKPGMFDGMRNTIFNGGNFVHAENLTLHNSVRASELLEKRVANAALRIYAQRIDSPIYNPDARGEILQKIYDWIIQSQHRDKWILWLNGAAGSNKSAVMRSIAERCARDAIAIASFFFFRADPTRNTTERLIATLAYQLIKVIPETSEDVLSAIDQDLSIFNQSLESQLQKLIIQPLLRVRRDMQRQFVVFIDGLNECNDLESQIDLIRVLRDVSRDGAIPIIFLVASRRESQIEAAFVDEQVSDLVMALPLDNSDIERTSDDIHHFLIDEFNHIKETHLQRHHIPTEWPPASAIEEITTRSSGQFIYASVVVKYVSFPSGDPAHRLNLVRAIRLRDASSQNPFAHLDALYRHIFSQVEVLDKVLDILAYVLITGYPFLDALVEVFLLEAGELEVYLANLTAVIKCEPHTDYLSEIRFLHASLPGFLLDESRSEIYHIDVDKYRTKFLCMLLERVPLTEQPHTLYSMQMQEIHRLYAISPLLQSRVTTSDRLQRSFTNLKFAPDAISGTIPPVIPMMEILSSLKTLHFDDRGQAYYHVLYVFAVWCAKHWGSICKDLKDDVRDLFPDLYTRISQILQQKS